MRIVRNINMGSVAPKYLEIMTTLRYVFEALSCMREGSLRVNEQPKEVK